MHTVYKLCDLLPLGTRCKYTRAEEYSDLNYRHHIILDHRFKNVGGENSDYYVHDLWGFGRIILKTAGHALVESGEEALKAVYYNKADDDRKGGR